jgi:hypothetical protein
MGKIKEMFEKHNTKKMAEKHGRSYFEQEYRRELAKQLKEQRKN